MLIRCSYREFALLSSAGQVTAPWEASRAELAPSGKVVVVEHEGRVVIAGADLKERVSLRFGAMPGAVVASGPGGVIERFGGEFEKLVLTALMCPWGHSGDLDPEKAARAVGVA